MLSLNSGGNLYRQLCVSKGKYKQVKYEWQTRKQAKGSSEVKLQ